MSVRSPATPPRPRVHPLMSTSLVTYAGLGLNLLSTPMLTRTVGADGRGVIAGSFVVLQIMLWISFLGLPRGLSLRARERDEVSAAGVVTLTGLGLVGAVLVAALAPVISGGDDRIETGIRVSALVLPLAGLAHLGSEIVLVRGRLIAFNVIRSMVLVVPSLGYIVAFLAGSLSVVVAYGVTLLGQMLAVLSGLAVAVPALRGARRRPLPWSFSLRYWIASAMDGVTSRLDQLILTATVSASVLGVYAVAVTCAYAAGGLTQAINHWTYSQMAAHPASAQRMVRSRAQIGVVLSLATGLAVVAAVAALGTRIFGADFDGLTPVVAVLVLAQLLHDQWSLRVYRDSAREEGSAIALSSAVAVVVLTAGAGALQVLGVLDGVTMAVAVVVSNATRLAVRGLLRRSSRSRRSARRADRGGES